MTHLKVRKGNPEPLAIHSKTNSPFKIKHQPANSKIRDIYSGHFPFWSKLKNREEFEGLEKRKGKGGKRRKKETHTLKYLYEA